jgi:hypothetical protein
MSRGLNLLKEKHENAVETTIERIATQAFGSGVDSDSSFLSLKAGIGASASDTTTYANISRSTYPQWAGNYEAATVGDMDDPAAADYILRIMGNWVNSVMLNGAQVENLVFVVGSTTAINFREAYMGLNNSGGTMLTSALNFRYDIKDGAGIPGFTGLTFSGIPVVQDPFCGAANLYLLDSKTTMYRGLANTTMKMGEWSMAEGSTSYYSRCNTAGQIIVKSPWRNAVVEWA